MVLGERKAERAGEDIGTKRTKGRDKKRGINGEISREILLWVGAQ